MHVLHARIASHALGAKLKRHSGGSYTQTKLPSPGSGSSSSSLLILCPAFCSGEAHQHHCAALDDAAVSSCAHAAAPQLCLLPSAQMRHAYGSVAQNLHCSTSLKESIVHVDDACMTATLAAYCCCGLFPVAFDCKDWILHSCREHTRPVWPVLGDSASPSLVVLNAASWPQP